ncbi:uncharacterized protein LOC120322324 [Drosophila yakuba]|uniref:uncharacterized protein LOC120322324 n=1 Tax=Drosophila yakuba TaxID=7245 RepID=UPI0019307BDA|nr:uncharacterized protein LOC120322324 [Drosophila yakuba]
MEINFEKLIDEIFLRPALWDQKTKIYHNRIFVEKNWTEMENIFETEKGCLKKKWKNIRDQFRSEWKKNPNTKSGDPGISEEAYSHYTSWPHFTSLFFLKDQMKPRNVLTLHHNLPSRKLHRDFHQKCL